MALTQQVRFSATIVDELGTTATTVAYALADPTGTGAQLATAAQTWAAALDGAIGGAITEVRATVIPAITGLGLKTTPDAGSRVEQTAVLNFTATGSHHRFGMAIPSVKDAAIVGGKLSLTDAGIVALVTLITTATGTSGYANTANQALVRLKDAIISFRKRRRELQRSSGELGLATSTGV